MALKKKLFLINEFFGGQSEASKTGVKGSFLYGDRLDVKTDLSSLTVGIKTTKDSSTTIEDLPKWIERDATNSKTYAYGDDGEWYSESSGTWTKETALTTAGGQGMRIWNDYIHFRKDSAIARYGALSSSPSLTQSWQTTDVETITDHAPINEFLGNLYFANGRYLTEWDNTTWTGQKLTLPVGWKIRAMAVLGEYLVMGGWQGTNIYDFNRGFLWLWNGTDENVTDFREITEGGVNAMYVVDNTLYFIAGSFGTLFAYNGLTTKIRKISNLLVGNTYVDIFPGAMDVHDGELMIGVAGATDSSAITQGVYSYGRPTKNYPNAVNIPHIISTGTKTGTTLKIGAVHSVGPNEFYTGFEDTTATNGIDKVSGTTPYASSTYHSLWFDDEQPHVEKDFDRIRFTFKPLVSNESITFYYRLDRASSWTSLGTASTANTTQKTIPLTASKKGKEIQLRVDLETTTTTAPKLLSCSVIFSSREITGDET